MSIQEIETAVTQLPSPELASFAAWFEEYQADLWDKQIEQDALSGRLDALAEQANKEFEAGRCRPRVATRGKGCVAASDKHEN